MSELAEQITQFKESNKVTEVTEDGDTTIIKALLPFTKVEETDVIDIEIEIEIRVSPSTVTIDIKSLPDPFGSVQIDKMELDSSLSLPACVDRLYNKIDSAMYPPRPFKVRDFGYPTSNPRHFGHYLPVVDKIFTWYPHKLRKDLSNQQIKLEKGEKIMVRKMKDGSHEKGTGGRCTCRWVGDHLPSNYFEISTDYVGCDDLEELRTKK